MTLDSKTRHGPGELADSVGSAARALLGSMRRMAIKVTSAALWQVIGHRMLDGGRETRDAEVFYGIGIWARPKSSERAEALVAFLGGNSGSPAIVASRNEDARRAVAAALNGGAGLAEGEAVFYGSGGALLHVKADNTAELRLPNGTAVALALKTDVSKIETAIAGATITPGDGGASLKATIIAGLATSLHGTTGTTTWPVGTTVLKAQ